MIAECFTPVGIVARLAHSQSESVFCQAILGSIQRNEPLPFKIYVSYFLITFALEFLGLVAVNSALKQGASTARLLQVCLVMNLCTHPAAFYLVPYVISLLGGTLLQSMLVAEAQAFVIEFFIVRWMLKMGSTQSLQAVVFVNLLSWWLGVYLIERFVL